ncbi:MAG: hypothetical protein MI924_24705 [Chloroflexales bacterium]|nr:hypothetical protein [Chloroflexales bacterium]
MSEAMLSRSATRILLVFLEQTPEDWAEQLYDPRLSSSSSRQPILKAVDRSSGGRTKGAILVSGKQQVPTTPIFFPTKTGDADNDDNADDSNEEKGTDEDDDEVMEDAGADNGIDVDGGDDSLE